MNDSKKPWAFTRFGIFTVMLVAVMTAGVLLVGLLFTRLTDGYQENVELESAQHLAEINYQVKLYMEEKIASDWKVAGSVANRIEEAFPDDDVHDFLLRERDIWGVSDVVMYTEDGRSISADRASIANDRASDTIYNATLNGRDMSVIQSSVTYTLPVKTELTVDGARVVAVSVIQDVSSFIDDMDFTSFGGAAYMYLTQDNGIVVSQLTHGDALFVYNILSIFEGLDMTCLTHEDGGSDHLLTSVQPETYILTRDDGSRDYVVSTPVDAGSVDMRVFYFVPDSAVNHTTTVFSTNITELSLMIIALCLVATLVTFVSLYFSRARKFDAELMARERMFDLLVKNSNTAFALFGTDGGVPRYISTNAADIIGDKYLTLEKIPGGYRMRNDTGSDTEAVRLVNSSMEHWDGRSEFRSGYIPRPDSGGERFYAFQLYPIDEGGREFVGIAQDVTNPHDREEAVKNALEMAQRSNEAKSRFLSNMSHDIRTPMNAIINLTDFSIDSIGEPEKQREYLETIRGSADHLLRLINDILDVSRIESGQMTVAAEPFTLKSALDEAQAIILPLCEGKRQTFISDTAGLDGAAVLGDKMKLSQVLLNLLNNAVKFTPEGGTVRLFAEEMPSLRSDVLSARFTVADDGMGISEEHLGHIFEPFMRADEKRVSGIEGTGLGLSICKSYISAMGGSITCQSAVDKGSTFVVELPFQRAAAETEAHVPDATESISFAGKRALLCEDNDINQSIALRILERLDIKAEAAGDGGEGVKMFLSSPPGYYDIIYMDIQMPILDGYQATKAIRRSRHPQAKTIPIVAMTANVFAEDVETSRAAGMNGHLGKPIIIKDLVEETRRVLGTGG